MCFRWKFWITELIIITILDLAAGLTGSLCLVTAGPQNIDLEFTSAGQDMFWETETIPNWSFSRSELTGNWEMTRTRTRIFQVKLKTLLTARAAPWSDLWFKQQHPAECSHWGVVVKWINAPQTPHFSRNSRKCKENKNGSSAIQNGSANCPHETFLRAGHKLIKAAAQQS